jgi:hypothetical protein
MGTTRTARARLTSARCARCSALRSRSKPRRAEGLYMHIAPHRCVPSWCGRAPPARSPASCPSAPPRLTPPPPPHRPPPRACRIYGNPRTRARPRSVSAARVLHACAAAERKESNDCAHHRAGADGNRHRRQQDHNFRGAASRTPTGSPALTLKCIMCAHINICTCASHAHHTKDSAARGSHTHRGDALACTGVCARRESTILAHTHPTIALPLPGAGTSAGVPGKATAFVRVLWPEHHRIMRKFILAHVKRNGT